VSVIFSRAPLRISLGGGTDLPSYYTRNGGYVVAATIDKYVYMLSHTVFEQRFRMKYSQLEEVRVGAGGKPTPLRWLRFDPLGWWRRRPGCW
jgi:galactokinase/mevalonate kinase-like predicted kinase